MIHSTKRFTFSSKTRTFVAELSDFGPVSPFRQIFQDSCDLGLTLHSHITGKELDFVINRTERNEEDNSVELAAIRLGKEAFVSAPNDPQSRLKI